MIDNIRTWLGPSGAGPGGKGSLWRWLLGVDEDRGWCWRAALELTELRRAATVKALNGPTWWQRDLRDGGEGIPSRAFGPRIPVAPWGFAGYTRPLGRSSLIATRRNPTMAPSITRRSFSGLDTDPWGPIDTIKNLLADVYRYDTDGRTIVRELFQNADDAGAQTLRFHIVEQGFAEAKNPLLHGPALVIVNDGGFPERDQNGLHRAMGGAKGDDAAKVGRFGLGLKSLFHLCEAFLYVGRDSKAGTLCVGSLNPWAGTDPEKSAADPTYPAWDEVVDEDAARLAELGRRLLVRFAQDGLLLWVPLRRRAEHLGRGADSGTPYGISERELSPADLRRWFADDVPLALLLAQGGSLQRVVATSGSVAELVDLTTLSSIRRDSDPGSPTAWVTRPALDVDVVQPKTTYSGHAKSDAASWSIAGMVERDDAVLQTVRQRGDWPRDRIKLGAGFADRERKAAGHASIALVRPTAPHLKPAELRVRWCVFFPLDDASKPPADSTLVETQRTGLDGTGAWDLLLHGYFWPSQDRRSIPGVIEHDKREATTEAADVRTALNRAIAEQLLFPMVPKALAHALNGVDYDWAAAVVDAVHQTSLGAPEVLQHICENSVLVPVIGGYSAGYQAAAPSTRLIALAGWAKTPEAVKRGLALRVADRSHGTLLIDGDAARLGGIPHPWRPEETELLLYFVPDEDLNSGRAQPWLAHALRVAHETPNGHLGGQAARTVAGWLAQRLGSCTIESTAISSWKLLFELVPTSWRVAVPRGAQTAVKQLASEGLFGEGLLAEPFGAVTARPPTDRAHLPHPVKLEAALRRLGELLRHPEASQRATDARLQLAEYLLAALTDEGAQHRVADLPLLRAHRLPEGRDEPWSLNHLRKHAAESRVFDRTHQSSEADGEDAERDLPAKAPVKRVSALAAALGEPCWLVRAGIAQQITVPQASDLSLAAAMASPTTGSRPLASDDDRGDLLKILGKLEVAKTQAGRSAIRALLTGGRKSDDVPLYAVSASGDTAGDVAAAARLLLGVQGLSWSLYPSSMGDLPHDVLRAVDADHPLDKASLHPLLAATMAKAGEHWPSISDQDARLLIKTLHPGLGESERLGQWRRMPLHLRADNSRGPVTASTYRQAACVALPSAALPTLVILQPDAALAEYYTDVQKLDREAVIGLLVGAPEPHRFAADLLKLLRESVGAPLRDKVLRGAWIPLTAHTEASTATSPDNLLLLPDNVQVELQTVARAGALRPKRFLDEVSEGVRADIMTVVRRLRGDPTAAQQVSELAEAIQTSRTAERGFHGLNLSQQAWPAELIDHALETPLVESDPGWRLLKAARAACGPRDETNDKAVTGLARSLIGPVAQDRQVMQLTTLAAGKPGQDTAAGKVHRALLDSFKPFSRDILAKLTLPVQSGTWRATTQIARSASGLAPTHLLRLDLREVLRLDDHGQEPKETTPPASGAPSERPPDSSADQLRRYFAPWRARIKPGVVGVFLAILSDHEPNGPIEALADEWLKRDPSFQERSPRELRERLLGGAWPTLPSPRVTAAFATADKVVALNLLGDDFEAPTSATTISTIFSQDPARAQRHGLGVWDIRLQHVDPSRHPAPDLEGLVLSAVEWWCQRALRMSAEPIQQLFHLARGSQLAVAPVRARIVQSLPATLRELDVQRNQKLGEALKRTEKAAIKVADVHASGTSDNRVHQQHWQALDALAKTITETAANDTFMLSRVRARMEERGYAPQSVLLELSQNADDALSQIREMGRTLPDRATTLTVRVGKERSSTILDVLHYGRPINETGGAAFPAGAERQWDQDLYFMMLMNMSAKPGEHSDAAPGNGRTTGKFGLGFKSVHLISDLPEVVSGYLSFEVAAGLMPEASARPDDPTLEPIGSCLPTRIRLPLRADTKPDLLLAAIFSRFTLTRSLIVAFARSIRRIVVEGGPSPGSSEFQAIPLAGGWSVSAGTVEVGGYPGWRLLRFAMRDRRRCEDSAALLLGLRGGRSASFPESVPFLWNVTPTEESWNLGYAVNGPIKLDPGRSHASLEAADTTGVFSRLGEALGDGLIALDDRLQAGESTVLQGLGIEADGVAVLRESIWWQLSGGLTGADAKRKALLLKLHGPHSGLHKWMSARAITPTQLERPFAPTLPAGIPLVLRVVTGCLAEAPLQAALADIDGLEDALGSVAAVSETVANVVQSIAQTCPSQTLDISSIFDLILSDWGTKLTPDRLASLRKLMSGSCLDRLRDERQDSWARNLQAQAQIGVWGPLRELLLPESRADKDEQLRAAFAPKSALLDDSYIGDKGDADTFRHLRVRYEADAERLWGWIREAPADRRPAALRYLVSGELKVSLLEKAMNVEDRPTWLQDHQGVVQLAGQSGIRPADKNELLLRLFPGQYARNFQHTGEDEQHPPADEQPRPLPRDIAERLLRQLHDQCKVVEFRTKLLNEIRDRWYPSSWTDDRLRDALRLHPLDDDESQTAWMILFTLATVQGLGRTQPEQHRGFVQNLMQRRTQSNRTWWSHLFDRYDEASNADTWFAFLEDWAERRSGRRLYYDHWLTTLPELFAAWRWLPDYRELVMASGRRQSGEVNALLRPGVDPEQDRGGIDAPALPMVRSAWLLSELIRLDVLPSTKPLASAAWSPSGALETVMFLLGLEVNRSDPRFSQKVHAHVAALLGPERDPSFYGCFDKALLSRGFQGQLEDECERQGLKAPSQNDLNDFGGGRLGDIPADPEALPQGET